MQKVKQVFSNSSDKSTDTTTSPTTSSTGAGNTFSNRNSVGSTGQTAAQNVGDKRLSSDAQSSGMTGARATDNTTGNTTTSPTIGGGAKTGQTAETQGSIGSKIFGNHTHGHGIAHANDIDSNNASHEHQHLKHVTHNDVRHIETEEVQREREHDRHIHHIQHHVQPVKDTHMPDEIHHDKAHPVTHINEKHSSTEHDQQKYHALGSQFKDQESHRPKERTVVDLGEKVNENVHHHVHHVIQPVVEREVHDRHRIHTVIPTKHTTHESPIVHQSTTHEPLHIKDFLSKGGKLDSTTAHGDAGVLHQGECERTVDGTGEELAQKLHLKV